jgi:hypothetical protein
MQYKQDKDFCVYNRKYLPNNMIIFHKELPYRTYEAPNRHLLSHTLSVASPNDGSVSPRPEHTCINIQLLAHIPFLKGGRN